MTRATIIANAATIRPGSLRPSRPGAPAHRGPATGDVWLQVGEITFPSDRWNDFVVVILAAWANAVVRLVPRSTSHEDVYFMEGPYHVELRRPSEEVFRVETIGPTAKNSIRADVEAAPFVASLLQASEAILAACRTQDCWSRDAEELEGLLPVVRGMT